MKCSKSIVVGIVVFMLIATLATIAAGQSNNQVSGFVRNSSNSSPVSGASIQVTSNSGPGDYTTFSGGNGYYSLDIPPGFYRITVTRDGYQPWEMDLNMGDYPETRDIYLDPEISGGNTGGDNVDGGFEMPFGDIDEGSIMTLVMILVALVVTFFICLITITIALMVISSRLGKIRKELVALNEAQKPKMLPAPQYQQPPPPPMV